MPLFEKLRHTSQETFELDSDSNESQDDWLDSPKRGIFVFEFFRFDLLDLPFDSIDIVSEGRGGPP